MVRPYTSVFPLLSLIIAAALWGVATVISKHMLGSVGPVTFLIIQLAPSVVVLWLVVLVKRALLSLRWAPLAALGVLNPGVSYTLSMIGLTTTSASVATLLWAAEPALIVMVAWLLREERINGVFLLATAAAAGGVLLVSGVLEAGDLRANDIVGPGLILCGVLICALYTVLMRRLAASYDPLAATAVQQTAGLAWALSIWPLAGEGGAAQIATLSGDILAAGALSGFMYYAAAFWFYLTALRTVRATTAGIFLNLTPLFGIATAWLFLGEHLTLLQWAGAAVIVASVVVLLIFAARRR